MALGLDCHLILPWNPLELVSGLGNAKSASGAAWILPLHLRSPIVLESGQNPAILLPPANPIGAFISFTESAGTSATARESASPTD